MQKFQKMIKYLGTAISVVMVGLAILLGFSVRWMFKTWPNLAVDELVFHLTEPLSGANQDMIIEYIVQCIVPMLLVLILFSVLLFFIRKTKFYRIKLCRSEKYRFRISCAKKKSYLYLFGIYGNNICR